MKIEVINRDAVIKAFTAIKDNGITTLNVDTVTDIIKMFPVLTYDYDEVFRDDRL